MDNTQIIARVRVHLKEHGMYPRGADKTDYQFPETRALFFRTGCAHNEVNIVPVISEVTQPAIRIGHEGHLPDALDRIDRIINDWRPER